LIPRAYTTKLRLRNVAALIPGRRRESYFASDSVGEKYFVGARLAAADS
jgi:hypothetical protein